MLRRFVPTALGLFACAAVALPLRSPAATELGHPLLQTFTPRTYGADAENICAVQDAAGVMYFGNTNGILTFDGAAWRVIHTGYSENIRGLARADDDTIYVGGSHQIGYLRPTDTGREFVSLADKLPPGQHDFSVFYRVIARDGSVYFTTRREVLVWHDGHFTVVPVANTTNDPIELYETSDDLFVCATNQPLQRLRGEKLEVVSDAAFFRTNSICMLTREADGALLLATARNGLFRWRNGEAIPVRTEVDALLHSPGLYRARQLSNGSLALMLAAQRGTVFVAADGRFLWRADDSVGLPSSVVFDVVPDREGGLWLCLATGLARLQWPGAFTLFDRAEGLPGHAWTMARHAGIFYFGTDEGLYRLVPGSAETGNARFELALKGRATALLSDPQGLIAATSNRGVVQLRSDGVQQIFAPAKPVLVMLRSHRDPNRIWLGDADNVSSIRHVAGAWRDEGAISGVPTGTRTLAETPDGALWTASMTDGVYRIRFGPPTEADPRGPAEVTHFDVGTHGLPPKHNTMRVYEWGGQPLFCMGGEGYWSFDPARETFSRLEQTTAGVPEPKKLSLFLNASQPDHLWVQRDTNLPRDLAIYRVPRRGAPQALPHAPVDAAHFARAIVEEPGADGGVLWVGGNDALLRVDVAHAFAPPPPIRVVIRSAGLKDGQRLGANPHVVEFEAIAPVFRSGGGPEYQTRLIGFEQDWSAWSEERKRVFTNLRPGAYRFEARARDNDGQVSVIASRSFTVVPPWWETWWFVGLIGVSSIGGVAGATRWFANRALKRRVAMLEAQSAVERERLRLARDLHDEVGSGLGRVILFAGEARRQQADPAQLAASLDRVRDTAQELVQHAREIVWAVSPQNDSLSSVVERLGDYVEETLRAAGIACTVEAPPPEQIPSVTLGSEARHGLFLALKEAVHNCVKYSDARTAEFRLQFNGDQFVITLRDHGRGFLPGEQRGTGHGTKNMMARAAALGGSAKITSSPDAGTTVEFRLLLPKPSP